MASKTVKRSGFSIWKLLRWVVLIAFIIVIVMMLQKPLHLSTTASAQDLLAASKSFDAKLIELELAHQQGVSGTTVEITENELNGLIERSAGLLPENGS